GPTEQAILRQCIREGRPYPKAIANAPDVEPESELYYFAFIDLGSCRNYEGGEIPWTAIKAYADEYALDEDQRVLMFNVIRSIDIWFLKQIQERAEKSKDARGNTKRGHGRGVKKVLPIGTRR